ncbi:MAG: DNA polymerase III subunit alpha [Anaerolineae bacterium]|nr:DNA polymerase III subunit alpha [Anaerolineae bacterium]
MYSELHCHSYYSLLDGTCTPAVLAHRAAALGMPALALTDHNAVYGAVEFVQACTTASIRPILGCELTLHDNSHLTLLVKNQTGWRNLCQLITLAQHNAPKGQARLPKGELAHYADGLIALSGCRRGAIPAALLREEYEQAQQIGRYLVGIFGRNNTWLELQNHHRQHDRWLNRALADLADRLSVSVVATNNIHYSVPDKHRLQDVLTCIRHLTTLDEAGDCLRLNHEFYLKNDAEMQALFREFPQAIANTQHIAERCEFELTFGLQHLPHFPTPPDQATIGYLRDLCEQNLDRVAAENRQRARQQLQHELTVIERLGFANYFLIVWDIVRFSRENGIRCQGRGSAANSLVAYLLNISPIDPLHHDLVFERFLSEERASTPDIDIDFDAARREEVIQYVYGRYGAAHVAMACTFSTFRTRAAVRDVSKVLQLSADSTAQAHDLLHGYEPDGPVSDQVHLVVDLCRELIGLPRHLGIHNGGLILTGNPLATRIPVEPATMENRTVVQWDKESLETAGIVKIDVLGLRMLSAIDEAERMIQRGKGIGEREKFSAFILPTSHFDDPAVYAMISAADTFGVFQVESRAQQNVALPHIQPNCFDDLITTISLIRPGPVQGNMVKPYFRRRSGQEPVTYLHPLLQPALAESLGIILFQEQVIKIGRDVAGFTAGEAELLRRALGKKNAYEAIAGLRAMFVAGAQGKGVSADIAHQIFDQLTAFGGYSFAKSHAAAFAVLVYQSAWLRCYHPREFCAALLNHQPMGFWSPAVLVGDARRRGIDVLPVHLEYSQAGCVVAGDGIRLGFAYVNGFGEEAIARLLEVRAHALLNDMATLYRRTRLPKRLLENLVLAGACDHWGVPRRKLLWQLGKLRAVADELPLPVVAHVDLPELSEALAGALETEAIGFSTGRHVMARIRPTLPAAILSSQALAGVEHGKRVAVAGLLVIRQQPQTAKGFVFLTLEDEFGLINVVLRPKLVTQTKKWPFRPSFGLNHLGLLRVEGIVQRQANVINILATKISPLNLTPLDRALPL